MLADAIWRRYEAKLTSPRHRTSLAALCALLRAHPNAAVVTADPDGAALPAVWDDAGSTDGSSSGSELPLHVVVRESGSITEVKFVPVGPTALVLLAAALPADQSPAPDNEVFSVQLPTGQGADDAELLQAMMSQLQLGPRPPRPSRPAPLQHAPEAPRTAAPLVVGGGGGGSGSLRYGDPDLLPAGTAPIGRGGGMFVGPDSILFRQPDAGWGPGGGGGGGLPDPGTQLGRYHPMFPGDDHGSMRGRGRGRGSGHAFPGEPDPDHLRPFSNNQLPPRGGGLGPSGRFNYGF